MSESLTVDRGRLALTDHEARRLREELDRDEPGVQRRTGLSKEALMRAAAGKPVYGGTRVALRVLLLGAVA